MEKVKKKKNRRRFLGLTIGEICALATLAMTASYTVIQGVHYFDGKFESIDRRVETMDQKFENRFDDVDKRLDRIEIDLKKTTDLLDVYLSWRFLYVNDPARKNLKPLYDPNERTLEFVDKNGRIVK